jgi:hypothetical protein
MYTLTRGTIVVLATGSLLFGLGSSAAAEIVGNSRMTSTVITMNPCAPEDGPIVLTTHLHVVSHVANDGTLFHHVNIHSEGVSANGTKYIANRQNVIYGSLDPATSFTSRIHRISAGSSDNAYVEIMVGSDGTTTTVKCSG